MLLAEFVSNHPNMGNTRTYEEFSKFIGTAPHRFGVVTRLYENLTATYLTETLRNIYYNDNKKANKYQALDSYYFEWEIESNHVKRVALACTPTENGEGGSEIVFTFRENYYQLHEIFKIDSTGQYAFVVAPPTRRADNLWDVTARLIDNDYASVLDTNVCVAGTTTRWIGNAKPEQHENGFVKYQSNIEKMRNWISTIRVQDSYSERYANMEDTFIRIAAGKDQGNLTEKIYKLEPMKKVLMDNFIEARETQSLMVPGNVDKSGKATISDLASNRPIAIGEGVIPQVERFANKYAVNKLSVNLFNQIMTDLNKKADKSIGNTYVFVVNDPFWAEVQNTLGNYLNDRKTDGAYLWSKGGSDGQGKFIKVGNTFDCYEWGGNKILFTVDRTLSREYNEPYALALDLTTGKTSSQPPIASFCVKNQDIVFNEMFGPGRRSGGDSGEVSTPVAGGMMTVWGTYGVAVFNPYRSAIVRVFGSRY